MNPTPYTVQVETPLSKVVELFCQLGNSFCHVYIFGYIPTPYIRVIQASGTSLW